MPLKGRVFKIQKNLCAVFWGSNSMAVRRCNKRRCANIRRRSEAKHCSSLCSQSEGDEYSGGQTRLKIQQSYAPERRPYSLRVRGPHFASKVSYNAGAATDDYSTPAAVHQFSLLHLSGVAPQPPCYLDQNRAEVFLDFECSLLLGQLLRAG